jgi:hypothetical protein
MTCPRCNGKGILLCQDVEHWRPETWNGEERRQQAREYEAANFKEVPAPFYTSCEVCSGLGRVFPDLISSQR